MVLRLPFELSSIDVPGLPWSTRDGTWKLTARDFDPARLSDSLTWQVGSVTVLDLSIISGLFPSLLSASGLLLWGSFSSRFFPSLSSFTLSSTTSLLWVAQGKVDFEDSIERWVSAGSDVLLAFGSIGCIRSLRSKRNNPLFVICKGIVFFNFSDHKLCFLVSITASMARSKGLLKRNGVDPGTTAIFNLTPWNGTIKACWLWRVPWLAHRKVTWHLHLSSFFLTSGLNPWIKDGRLSLPITVLVAPRSTTPKLSCDAKSAISWTLGNAHLEAVWACGVGPLDKMSRGTPSRGASILGTHWWDSWEVYHLP